MSFFRSAEDVTESEDTSSISRVESLPRNISTAGETYSINRVRSIETNSVSREERSDTFSPSSAPASFHANALLHSLLEERCMQEALNELRSKGARVDSIDHPQVRALGSSKYLRQVNSLSALGVVKRGIDSQHYSPLRQNYIAGLDLISQQNGPQSRPKLQKAASQMDMALPETMRKFVAPSMDPIDRHLGMMTIADGRPTTFDMPNHPLLDDTKYAREFDEFSMLGKGGYGVVFHVKHKLDGGSYAVKKIPMSPHRIKRIQQNGDLEFDNILLELRTLARLNHPNVVRYHTGWIEYGTFATKRPRPNLQRLLQAPEESAESAVTAPSIDIQFQFDDDIGSPEYSDNDAPVTSQGSFSNDDSQGILFEDSVDHENHAGSRDYGDHEDQGDHLSVQSASLRDNELHKTRSHGSTFASVSDEELEVIPRAESPTSTSGLETSFTGNEQPGTLQPCLALHIQMSLYSMTLADFLSPSDGDLDSSTISSLRHCFHPSAALSMLLAIIDGVKYLHSEGIVHRDLKPGNIFLAVRPGTDCPPGAFDVSSCTHCERLAARRPFNMDVCIGDFGLVSAIARPEDKTPTTPSRIVGTEIYRPESVTRDNHPSLDFYALGVIAFELVWRFGTRMERHEILHKLKKGEFPNNFEEHIPDCPGLMDFIKSMVLASEETCPTWQSLKKDVIRLMADC